MRWAIRDRTTNAWYERPWESSYRHACFSTLEGRLFDNYVEAKAALDELKRWKHDVELVVMRWEVLPSQEIGDQT